MNKSDIQFFRDDQELARGVVSVCGNWFERARGLLGREQLPENCGLWITSCASVHTCFMTYRLDLIYLSKENNIVKLVRNVAPWRFSAAAGSRSVIEYSSGSSLVEMLRIGDRVKCLT